MAYDRDLLQRIGPQNRNSPSFFTFRDDGSTLAVIDGSGFFDDAADILLVDDLIYAAGSDGRGVFVVDTNTRDLDASPPVSGVVDLTNADIFGASDSD